MSLWAQGHSAVQLPREPLLTAEVQHFSGEHSDAFQLLGMAGHQEH